MIYGICIGSFKFYRNDSFIFHDFIYLINLKLFQLVIFICLFQKTGCLYEHLRWGDAFVVVYSICDKPSFSEAEDYLQQLTKLKLPSYYTTLLLGNKRDLDHSRYVYFNEIILSTII